MIKKLVEIIDYEGHLKKTQQDWESRWENVRELITFASEVESELLSRERQMEALSGPPASQYVLFIGDTQLKSVTCNSGVPYGTSCNLRCFRLKGITTRKRKAKRYDLPWGLSRTTSWVISEQKVTISTCHAAKGLEWPVVIVPSGMCSFVTTDSCGYVSPSRSKYVSFL